MDYRQPVPSAEVSGAVRGRSPFAFAALAALLLVPARMKALQRRFEAEEVALRAPALELD